MNNKRRKWFVLFPDNFYAIEFFDVNSINELKQEARKFLGVNRLPNGTECWANNN